MPGSCFPPEVRRPHGLPLLGRLRGAPALPDVRARMQPSDSPAASTGALVPLAVGLPSAVRFSAPAWRAYGNARRVGRLRCGSSAAPRHRWTNRGLPGYWAVLTYVPWSATPPRGIPPRPWRWHPLLPSAAMNAWASRDKLLFGADFARPTCSPTYASTGVLAPRLQGWLPTCRATLWSGGTCTRWTTNRISEVTA